MIVGARVLTDIKVKDRKQGVYMPFCPSGLANSAMAQTNSRGARQPSPSTSEICRWGSLTPPGVTTVPRRCEGQPMPAIGETVLGQAALSLRKAGEGDAPLLAVNIEASCEFARCGRCCGPHSASQSLRVRIRNPCKKRSRLRVSRSKRALLSIGSFQCVWIFDLPNKSDPK